MSDYPPPPPPPPPPPGQPGQPGQPGPYGQPPQQPYQPYQPYGGGYAPPGPPPGNNLVWAILSVFCCLIGGVVAIVYAAQVDGKWARGDFAGAEQSAKNARTWAIASIVIGGILTIGYVMLAIATGFSESSEF